MHYLKDAASTTFLFKGADLHLFPIASLYASLLRKELEKVVIAILNKDKQLNELVPLSQSNTNLS